MIEATFSNWSNPGAIAAVLALRSLFDPVVLGYVADEFGPRSIYTAVVGCLVVLSTALTAVLLTTGWLGHTTSYAEQLSQLLLVGVSGYAFTRRRSKRTPAPCCSRGPGR